jgi:hypothetical protein
MQKFEAHDLEIRKTKLKVKKEEGEFSQKKPNN